MFTASYSDHYPKVLERDLTYGRPWSRIRPTYYLQELYDETKDAVGKIAIVLSGV